MDTQSYTISDYLMDKLVELGWTASSGCRAISPWGCWTTSSPTAI